MNSIASRPALRLLLWLELYVLALPATLGFFLLVVSMVLSAISGIPFSHSFIEPDFSDWLLIALTFVYGYALYAFWNLARYRRDRSFSAIPIHVKAGLGVGYAVVVIRGIGFLSSDIPGSAWLNVFSLMVFIGPMIPCTHLLVLAWRVEQNTGRSPDGGTRSDDMAHRATTRGVRRGLLPLFMGFGAVTLIGALVAGMALVFPTLVQDKTLLDSYSDEEIQALYDKTPAKYRNVNAIERAFYAREITKNITDKPVSLTVGDHRYRVPMNYITSDGDFKGLRSGPLGIDFIQGFDVVFYLPDYRGYDRKTSIWESIDWRVSFNRVSVHVYTRGSWRGGMTEAEDLLELKRQEGKIEREPSLSQYGLTGYKQLLGKGPLKVPGVVWMGKGTHGQAMILFCDSRETACEVNYHHKANGYWLDYWLHNHSEPQLPHWREIDDAINQKILSWRVD